MNSKTPLVGTLAAATSLHPVAACAVHGGREVDVVQEGGAR